MAKIQLEKTIAAASTTLKGFKIKKRVTLPLWKWSDGVEKFFTVTGEIHIGRAVSDKRPANAEGKKAEKSAVVMEPAHIATVIDLTTRQECEIIVGAVLKSTLEENYPNHGYVGKSFASIQSKVEGKRYRQYTLTEIEAE